MKNLITILVGGVMLLGCQKAVQRPETLEASVSLNPQTMESSFYDFEMKDLEGKSRKFSEFKGKKIHQKVQDGCLVVHYLDSSNFCFA